MKYILIVLVIIVGLAVILPLTLNIAGFKIFQFASFGANKQGTELLFSSDSGANWQKIGILSKKSFPISSITTLKFHPLYTNTIFIGTISSGLLKSEDGGKTWNKISDLSGDEINDLAFYQRNPQIGYVAIFSKGFGKILKTENGGRSFKKIYQSSVPGARIKRIFLSNTDAQHLLVADSRGGFFETRDGGYRWHLLRWFEDGIEDFAVNPVFPHEFYILTSGGKLWKTLDEGKSWKDLTSAIRPYLGGEYPPRFSSTPLIFLRGFSTRKRKIIINSTSPVLLYIALPSGIFKSSNRGSSWIGQTFLIPPEEHIDAFAINPQNPLEIYAAAKSQFYRSIDGGINWSLSDLPKGRIVRDIFINPADSNIIYLVR